MKQRRDISLKVALGAGVFAAGLAASLAVFTPSAQPRSADCVLTVVCTDTLPSLPTTLPSLPTTVTTVTETLPTLPIGPGTTSGSTTTGASPGGSSGSTSTTTSTVGTTPVGSTVPASESAARIALRSFRATARRVGKRRWLTLTFDANMRASGVVRLSIPWRRAFVKTFGVREGRNVRRFVLPVRAGTGRRQLLLTLRSARGDAQVRAVIKLPR